MEEKMCQSCGMNMKSRKISEQMLMEQKNGKLE